MIADALRIRRAGRQDELALLDMQATSIRVLGRGCYDPELIRSFVAHVGTMDPALLDDGRYFVGELGDELAVCGGWSTRAERRSDLEWEAPVGPEPVLHAVYVAPLFVRLGLGRSIVETIEADILRAGFDSVTLSATLSAVPFYERLGFAAAGRKNLPLPDRRHFPCVTMRKTLKRPTLKGLLEAVAWSSTLRSETGCLRA